MHIHSFLPEPSKTALRTLSLPPSLSLKDYTIKTKNAVPWKSNLTDNDTKQIIVSLDPQNLWEMEQDRE